MNAPNKFFSISITLVLLTTIFVPHFVLATDEPIEPAPVEIAPEAPAPEVPTPEILAPEVPVVETPTEENIIVENPLTEITEPEISTTETLLVTPEPAILETETITEETQTQTENITLQENLEPIPDILANEVGQQTIVETPLNLSTLSITLTVATSDDTLISEPITVTACESIPGSGTYTLNAWCAITQIAATKGWTLMSSTYGNDIFLNAINSYSDTSGTYWFWFNGTELGQTGLNQHLLTEYEKLYVVFGTSPLKVTIDNPSPAFGTTSTISVYQFGFDETWSPVWLPALDSSVEINGNIYTTTNGSYEYYNFHPHPISIIAKKTGFIASPEINFQAVSPITPIRLSIQTMNGELFNNTIEVGVCPVYSETSSDKPVYTVNALCAVGEYALHNNGSYGVDWFGDDAFLNEINEYRTDFSNGKFWSWYSNLQLGETGINRHVLSSNENLLLTYGINPIKLEVSSTTPSVGASTTISISELNFAAWPAEWVSLPSTTLHLNDTTIDISTGTYTFVPTATTTVFVTKTGYVSSDIITIIPGAAASISSNSTNTESTGGGGNNSTPQNNSVSTFNVESAAQYVYSQQKTNGAIGSATLYSDWAAIALGSLGSSDAKTNLIAYLKTDPSPGSMSTDYERRAMALLALGINPYSDTKTNYIAKILSTYDGTQFGDAGLVNDDIFALFPLLKSGYSTSDAEIQKSVAFILSRQNSNGSWESPDMTAAAVQALSPVKSITGVNEALEKAKQYLKLSTKTDGRIGDNDFSTSWGVQALYALGESVQNWNDTNTSPLTYLANQQQSDGGVQPSTASPDNRIWSTSYALPAVQGKTWYSLLSTVSKPTVLTPTVIPGVDIVLPTTTLPIATSTPTTTSTPTVLVPTTTPVLVVNPEVILPTTTLTTITQESTEPIPTLELPTSTLNDQFAPAGLPRTLAAEPPATVPDSELRVLPPNTPENENKALLRSALAVAGTAGTYLAYRLIQGLV